MTKGLVLKCRVRSAALCVLFAVLRAASCWAAGTPPVITVQPVSQSVSLSNSVTFSVTASSGTTMSYQWRKDGASITGATSNSYSISSVTSTNAAGYTVKVVNSSGSVTSSVATLTVVYAPVITNQPQNQSIALGLTASLTVAALGAAPLSYQWTLNGANLNATNAILSITNVQTVDSGNYAVVITNSWGTATSAMASLTVLIPPSVTTQPQDQAVVVGQSASFSVEASGTTPLSYRWRLNGSAISGATNATLALSNVQSNQAGSYSVVVSNAAGSVTSSVATLTVNVPAMITTQPVSQITTQGLSAGFSVLASGTAPLSYQWRFNDTNLTDATNASLALSNVQTNDAGSYTVLVTNNWGSVTSSVARLTVYVPPTITPQPQDQAVVVGQTANFSVLPNGASPFGYQWRFNGSALSGATNAALALSNVQSNQAGS